MNIKLITLLTIAAFAVIKTQAQDLSSKIPADARFVLTFNNKAIVDKNSTELLYNTLVKLGAFEDTDHDADQAIKKFLTTDLDLNKHAYIYLTSNDSTNYTGILLPLKSDHQVKEHMFSQFNKLPKEADYERRVSTDGTTQVAWNQEALLILTGSFHYAFFQQDDVANRYGLDLGEAGEAWGSDEAWVSDEAWASSDTIDATELLETEVVEEIAEAESAAVELEEEVIASEESVDAAEDLDELEDWEYESEYVYDDKFDTDNDSTYLEYLAREQKNDSIKNTLIVNWLANDFNGYLNPEKNLANNKEIKITSQTTLARLFLPNLDLLYREIHAYSMLKFSAFDLGKIDYGYKSATIDLIQQENVLKINADITLDQKMADIFKAIYNNKVNKKFTNYIPENYLAYASSNLSTEGYLQQIPTLITNWYAPFAGEENAELLSIVATALEISLDEKSIAKIMKGDQVFFLNDLQKVSKEYTTYEYDDDYNYEEVTKIKDVYEPNFLWMFTSEDQRLFKKIIEFAQKKEKISLDNGIYSIEGSSDWGQLYLLLTKDIVFLGSDLNQITAIKENRFKGARNNKTKKDIKNYPFNLVVNTSAIPDVLNKLEIPLTETWGQTVENLAQYGNLEMRSFKLKKNKVSAEIKIELPKKEANALQFILTSILENIDN